MEMSCGMKAEHNFHTCVWIFISLSAIFIFISYIPSFVYPSVSHTYHRLLNKHPKFFGNNESSHQAGVTPGVKITMQITGRLGNQLFELAALQGIASVNRLQIVFPTELLYLFSIFNLQESLRTFVEGNNNEYIIFKSRNIALYDIRTESIVKHVNSRTNIKLVGYYQSFKYFKNIENEIRHQLTFKENIKRQINQYLISRSPALLINSYITYIGIHIRKGDFLTARKKSKGMITANERYIVKAKDHMREHFDNILFVATSDDKQWISQHALDNMTIISPFTKAELDLALLASCNHTIISSGTYSWWAGWLANGTTIYYDQYPKPGSKLSKRINVADYYPPHWIPLS